VDVSLGASTASAVADDGGGDGTQPWD